MNVEKRWMRWIVRMNDDECVVLVVVVEMMMRMTWLWILDRGCLGYRIAMSRKRRRIERLDEAW